MKRKSGIIGIDEVGRGSLAGPVMVAAVFVPRNNHFRKLKDSKKLSSRKREEWFEYVRQKKSIFYTISAVSPKIIDKINISEAANLAAARALKKLIVKYKLPIVKIPVYLDGGLYIRKKIISHPHKLKTLIKGDEKINAIKIASIIAKVKRDRLMVRLHKKYPKYSFERHKGYGTKAHFLALKLNNICETHRITFLRKLVF